MGSVAAEALGEAAAGRLAIEGATEGLKARVEIVEVPAQPHAVGGPLGDEVLAVVDEEEELSRHVFDRGGGVGVFVGVDSDRDQLRLLSFAVSSDGRATADGTGWGF